MRVLVTGALRPAYSVLDLTATERLLDRRVMDWRAALAHFLSRTSAEGPES